MLMETNKKFKAVIFDLDGTLLDSLESIAMGANAVLEELGFSPCGLEEYRSFVGKGAKELIRQALYAAGDTELKNFEKALEIHKSAYKKYALYKIKKYDGIAEVIEKLKKAGIIVAVNSNKPEARAIGVLDTMFGENTFDIIVGQVEERRRKPYPDGCLLIADKFGFAPKECMYVGDTDIDMKTGKAAQMYTVGAVWGFRTREELEACGADIAIDTPYEILKLTNIQVD